MSFVPKKSGEWEVFFPKKTASVAFLFNAAMDWPGTSTGFVVKATNATTKFAGIAQVSAAAADATNAVIACLRPKKHAKGILVATTSGAAATDIGLRCDLTDEQTVDRGSSNVGRVIIDEYYSSTSIGVHFLEPVETGSA